MVWAKLDDEILDNDKIVRAGILGFALHTAAVTWCCRNLTDGFIPRRRALTLFDMAALSEEFVESLGSHPQAFIDGLHEAMFDLRSPTAEPAVERLIACGLWRYDDARDGYWLKDFLTYNPSRAEVEAKRAQERQKKARHSDKSSRRDSPGESPGESSSVPSGILSSPVPDPVNTNTPLDPPSGGGPTRLVDIVPGNAVNDPAPTADPPKRRRDERGTRLPEDWEPSPELVAQLRAKFAVDPLQFLPRFRNYWLSKPGKDGRKLDWDRTFANWAERDAETQRRNPSAGRPDAGARMPYHDVWRPPKGEEAMATVDASKAIQDVATLFEPRRVG